MNTEQLLLAKKYATAFLNVFSIDFASYKAIAKTIRFFKDSQQARIVLEVPTLDNVVKLKLLEKIFEHHHAPLDLLKLVALLLKQQRLLLLPAVLLQIIGVYQERNNLITFTFYGSHELTEQETTVFSQFLAQKINKNIVYHFAIDKELIAGIRLQSDTWLWEYSAEKQLRAIENSLY